MWPRPSSSPAAAVKPPQGDYTSVNQTLTFAAGQTQQTVQVAIGQDSALESNETFSLTSSPSAGNIETASASLTINDDDQSTWSIAANASAPIDEGAGLFSTVTRSGATNSATVQVALVVARPMAMTTPTASKP